MSVIYKLKLETLPTMLIFYPWYAALYIIRAKKPRPLSLHVISHLQGAGVNIQQVKLLPCLPAPWTFPVPEIHLDLSVFKKVDLRDLIFLQHLKEILSILVSILSFTASSKVPHGGAVAEASALSCYAH